MHEVSLCESILKIIERQAERDKFARVVEVVLSVGDRSGASAESLAFCFPLVAKGTIADGATLTIRQTKGAELKVKRLEVGV